MTAFDIIYLGIGAALAIALAIASYIYDWGDQGPLYLFLLFMWPFIIMGLIGEWFDSREKRRKRGDRKSNSFFT